MKPNLLLVLFTIFIVSSGVSAYQKVLLQNVQSLVLYNNEMTTARRASPIPQLQCSGYYCSYNRPETVFCKNVGFDGRDVNWNCEAQLAAGLYFGKMIVNCEGFDYPNDSYIVDGSCGLEYTLKGTPFNHNRRHRLFDGIIDFVCVALLISLVFVALVYAGLNTYDFSYYNYYGYHPRHRWGNRFFGNYYYYDNYHPHHVPSSPPPTFNTGYATTSRRSHNQDNHNSYSAASSAPPMDTTPATGYATTSRRSHNQEQPSPADSSAHESKSNVESRRRGAFSSETFSAGFANTKRR
jgi:hypothetical protein